MKQKGFFILAIIFGLIAAGTAYLYVQKAAFSKTGDTQPLVVAKSNVNARSIINNDQLTIINVPKDGYPQGGTTAIQNVSGTVALINLSAGDPVLASMVQKTSTTPAGTVSSTGSNPSLTVPEGKRALAIPISLVSGVGYIVRPGDHVDVLVTMDQKDDTGATATTTSLAAQDVLVLSVGDSLSSSSSEKTEAKSYILALSVPQAMVVTLGSEKGSIRLLLRNPASVEKRTDTSVSGKILVDPNFFNLIQ